jgi:hypothetical protein
MSDRVLAAFLDRQLEEGRALAAESDLFDLVPIDGPGRQRYLVELRCTGLVQRDGGEIVEADRFVIGVWFPDHYLREADPYRVLTWLDPIRTWHPNIRAPFVCAGRISPGTPLVDLVYRCFELVTFNRVTMREDDSLNREACAWARHNLHRFPIDSRPLKRRAADFAIETLETMP